MCVYTCTRRDVRSKNMSTSEAIRPLVHVELDEVTYLKYSRNSPSAAAALVDFPKTDITTKSDT